jgi:branched-chain amino acid aminotransferase
LITPPVEEILPGITRKYVLQICQEEQIEVREEPILLKELDRMDSCFISGTSPKVLPVWQLDGFQFNTDHRLLQLIMERFEAMTKENLVSLT